MSKVESKKEYRFIRGSDTNHNCKASVVKLIGKNTCKNNCRYYDNKKRKCLRGYNAK